MTGPKPARWYRLTPDRVVICLLIVECLLWMSSAFGWPPMIWTYLIAVAAVGTTIFGVLLAYLACVFFRWRFQFGIRFLLVLVMAVALPFSWLAVEMKQAKKEWVVLQVIYKEGGDVSFGYERIGDVEPPGPAWLQELLGLRFFMHITNVFFVGDHVAVTDAGLEGFKRLPQLRFLQLDDTQVTDAGLEHLEGLNQLEVLRLNRTKVTDAGLEHLAGLTKLGGLFLAYTEVADAGLVNLKGMTRLQYLDLSNTKVTDAGLSHLAGLTQLQALGLDNTKVTDAGLETLKGLTQLQELHLKGTTVTVGGEKKPQRVLPYCKIIR